MNNPEDDRNVIEEVKLQVAGDPTIMPRLEAGNGTRVSGKMKCIHEPRFEEGISFSAGVAHFLVNPRQGIELSLVRERGGKPIHQIGGRSFITQPCWKLPMGGYEHDKDQYDLRQTALREFREETRYPLRAKDLKWEWAMGFRIPSERPGRFAYHEDIFFLVIGWVPSNGDQKPLDPDVERAQFFPIERLPADFSKSHRRKLSILIRNCWEHVQQSGIDPAHLLTYIEL